VLNITGAVGDLHPGFGCKALACALMGLPYYTIKNDRFQRALDLGFASFTKAEFGWLDNQKLELLISDDNFNSFQMPSGDLLKQARRMICYSSRDDREKLISQFSPTNVLQIYDRSLEAKMLRDSNYLLLW
jgi:hypothetical protein